MDIEKEVKKGKVVPNHNASWHHKHVSLYNPGSWPSGPMVHLDSRKGPFWTMPHRMYNIHIMDHFNYKYMCIITRSPLIYLVMMHVT